MEGVKIDKEKKKRMKCEDEMDKDERRMARQWMCYGNDMKGRSEV